MSAGQEVAGQVGESEVGESTVRGTEENSARRAGESAARLDSATVDRGGALGADADPVPSLGSRLIRHGPWGALAERWVPEPLRAARVGPGRRGAVVICAVGMVAAAVAAFLVWQDRPQPRPVSSVTSMSAGTSPAVPDDAASAGRVLAAPGPTVVVPSSGLAPAASPGESSGAIAAAPATAGVTSPVVLETATPAGTGAVSVIVVSVTGLVKHPGLVRLPPGARVADAIEAAGGVVGRGDVTGMNLAARLTDGSSVVVGESGTGTVSAGEAAAGAADPPGAADGGSAGGSSSGTDPPARLDLNSADAAALDALPGVGPVTAAAIVAYRQQHGPFTSVNQLQAIAGIGPTRFAQIAPHVTVGGAGS